MNEDLVIAVLIGTTRAQRQSIKVARLVAELGNSIPGIKTVLVDPLDFTFAGDGNDPEGKDERYTAIVQSADAFFIVTPEYNHSFPGSLKRMLDSELAHYIHKPVAFAGVSSGRWGGLRTIEALVNTVREMGMVACFTDAYFPKVQDTFDESGKLLAPFYESEVQKIYEELIWMATALKHARRTIPSKYHIADKTKET